MGFAICTAVNPDILILDEPASGLDPAQIVNMRKTVKKLAENHTIILSTHLMQEAESLCDKIIILNHGKVLIAGTIDSITGETKTKNLEEAFFYLVKKSDGEENYSF